jgi:hypothetical protein
MRVLLPNGELDPRIEQEPRLSSAQRQALLAVAATDDRAKVIGLDEKMRPVVVASLPGPNGSTKYALLRNGDPTGVTGRRLVETWPESRRRG